MAWIVIIKILFPSAVTLHWPWPPIFDFTSFYAKPFLVPWPQLFLQQGVFDWDFTSFFRYKSSYKYYFIIFHVWLLIFVSFLCMIYDYSFLIITMYCRIDCSIRVYWSVFCILHTMFLDIIFHVSLLIFCIIFMSDYLFLIITMYCSLIANWLFY